MAKQKTAELLDLSNERLQDAVKARYSEVDYYKILNENKALRNPKEYLKSLEGTDLIKAWEEDFYGNNSQVVVSYMSKNDYEKFVEGFGSIGRPGEMGGQFVLPESIANDIEARIAQMGSIQNCTPEFKKQLAIELGLPETIFDSGAVRVEIPLDTSKYNTDLNLHIVTGIEEGCNYQWVPGTKTLGGIREGIINQITKKDNEELFKWITDNVKRQVN